MEKAGWHVGNRTHQLLGVRCSELELQSPIASLTLGKCRIQLQNACIPVGSIRNTLRHSYDRRLHTTWAALQSPIAKL